MDLPNDSYDLMESGLAGTIKIPTFRSLTTNH